MEPPEYSERLAWAVCCTVGAILGLSAVPLVLRLPAEYTRPLVRLGLNVPRLPAALNPAG